LRVNPLSFPPGGYESAVLGVLGVAARAALRSRELQVLGRWLAVSAVLGAAALAWMLAYDPLRNEGTSR
jgi:hypothetical protein